MRDNNSLYLKSLSSPLGKIYLTSDGVNLTGLYYADEVKELNGERQDLLVFKMTEVWLKVYFNGKEPSFTPPLKLTGTVFQKQVYEYILSIPYGKRASYGQVAKAIARKRGLRKMSAQAVGQALKVNKISIIVPCHRIIKNDGSLGGYGGGIARKIFLLELESQGKALI